MVYRGPRLGASIGPAQRLVEYTQFPLLKLWVFREPRPTSQGWLSPLTPPNRLDKRDGGSQRGFDRFVLNILVRVMA